NLPKRWAARLQSWVPAHPREPSPRKAPPVGLKVDSSFLKFVTMGALGARRICELMAHAGLQPIELERYSRSNKIWSTKVKRLRLPGYVAVKALGVVGGAADFPAILNLAEHDPEGRVALEAAASLARLGSEIGRASCRERE